MYESASDRRRSLARERLQRCHLADIKLFFPSHSQSPAYVRTALLVTIQIFVVVLLDVVFVVSCNWFFPANHKRVSVLFLFTCILYCIAFLLLREAFLRMRITSNFYLRVCNCTVHFLRANYNSLSKDKMSCHCGLFLTASSYSYKIDSHALKLLTN